MPVVVKFVGGKLNALRNPTDHQSLVPFFTPQEPPSLRRSYVNSLRLGVFATVRCGTSRKGDFQLGWVVLGIFVPELVLWRAISQWYFATKLRNQLNELEADKITSATGCPRTTPERNWLYYQHKKGVSWRTISTIMTGCFRRRSELKSMITNNQNQPGSGSALTRSK
jgi:hypothetical protein